jgi:hypothetical protein
MFDTSLPFAVHKRYLCGGLIILLITVRTKGIPYFSVQFHYGDTVSAAFYVFVVISFYLFVFRQIFSDGDTQYAVSFSMQNADLMYGKQKGVV